MGLPAVVKKGNVIYFSHPVFSQYNQNAAPWCKKLVHNAIDMLMPERIFSTNGPSTLVTSLNHQPAKNRYVAHFLHYIPMQRGLDFQTLEEVIPLYDLEVSLKIGMNIKTARLVPEGKEIKIRNENNNLDFVLPKLEGHQMVELSY